MAADPLPPNDDLRLHQEISPKERLDAILESEHLTLPQSTAALSEMHRANQATFTHIIVGVVMVGDSPSTPESEWAPTPFYFGPFRDRRAAEQ